jgi:hypothetical protein
MVAIRGGNSLDRCIRIAGLEAVASVGKPLAAKGRLQALDDRLCCQRIGAPQREPRSRGRSGNLNEPAPRNVHEFHAPPFCSSENE